MTENELARAIFGKREGDGNAQRVTVVSGTAVEDSADGTVKVDLGGEVVSPGIIVDEDTGEVVVAPPQQAVEVPTTGGVKEGDTVTVIVDDGIPTSGHGTGSVDRVEDLAESASTTAQEAAAVAAAVGQHFWHNDSGAHVTEATREDYEQEPSGFQQLMTSIGTLLTRAVNGIEYLLRSDTQSGTAFYDGTCTADDANLDDHVVASFTTGGAQIGRRNQNHVEMDFNSFNMLDRENHAFYTVEDLRDEDGVFEYKETFPAQETVTDYGLQFAPVYDEATELYAIEVKHGSTTLVQGTDYTVDVTASASRLYASVVMAHEYATGEFTVTYTTENDKSKRVMLAGSSTAFNIRNGAMSSAFGDYVVASGYASHAEGAGAVASGYASHAEGGHEPGDLVWDDALTTASGYCSHAEGDETHATGNTAHAEGWGTQANGVSTHAEGRGTVAYGGRHHVVAQHVEGKFNVIDVNGDYAHIIGDGSNNSNRSNLHTVNVHGAAWYKNHGNVICSDGTNIRCDNQTIGTADNLSYVTSRNQSETPYTLLVGAGGNGVWYRRVGVLVELYIRAGSNWGGTLPANQFKLIGTLPAGCRPAHNFQFGGNITGDNHHVQFNLETDGTLKAYCNAAKSYFYGHTMYFTI